MRRSYFAVAVLAFVVLVTSAVAQHAVGALATTGELPAAGIVCVLRHYPHHRLSVASFVILRPDHSASDPRKVRRARAIAR